MSEFSRHINDICRNAVTAQGLFIGTKLGLFSAISQLPQPFTPQQLADASKCKIFYVREWLLMMAASKVLQLHPRLHFSLPNEHLQQLTSPLFTLHQIMGFASHSNDLISCMKLGGPTNFPCDLHGLMIGEEHSSALPHMFNIVAQQVPGLLQLLDEGCRVLDIGCGEGKLVEQLGKQYPKSNFTGIDPWLDASKETDNVSLQPYSASELPTEWSANFDYVIAMNSLHHVEDGKKAIGEMRRVLKDGRYSSVLEIYKEEDLEKDILRPGAGSSYITNMMFKAAHREHHHQIEGESGGQSKSEGEGKNEGQGQSEGQGQNEGEGLGEESDEPATLFQTSAQLLSMIKEGGFTSVEQLAMPRCEFLDLIHLLARKTGD